MARDLGPQDNARVRAAFPGHRSWVAVDGGAGTPARLLGYEEGMLRLWGDTTSRIDPQPATEGAAVPAEPAAPDDPDASGLS